MADGDRLAMRSTGIGTHQGQIMGIAPTANRAEVAGMDISRICGGKMAESWSNYDVIGIMGQLGVIPSPEQAQD